MSQFLLKSLAHYKERLRQTRRFETDCLRVRELLEIAQLDDDDIFILLLTPLIEIAWVDGRIGRYEQDAILHAADRYGLLRKEANFFILMDRLSSRPNPKDYENWWEQISGRFRLVTLPETAAIASHLLEQSKHIAGLGQKQLFGLWRGHGAGPDEVDALETTQQRLRTIETKLAEPEIDVEGSENLLKLVALVDVAWADGRVTKKERKLIFDSFFDLGIKPSNDNIQRLLSWLKLSPSGEFVKLSLQRLRQRFESLPDDERAAEKYSLISQCTLIAEASGGSSDFAAGGARICDEEIIVVKRIASMLNGAITRGGGRNGGSN